MVEGIPVSSTLPTKTIYLGLAALTVSSATLLARGLWQRRGELHTNWRSNSRLAVFVFFALAAFTYAVMTMYTYFQGIVPVLQGRFLAPATVAYVLLFASGWWLHRQGARVLWGTALGLFVVSLLLLWGNLLPYHYYWSSVNAAVGAQPTAGLDGVRLFWSNLVADKPAAIVPLLPLPAVLYLLVAAATFFFTWRWAAADRRAFPRAPGV